jgi:hypothetical protein
MDFHSPLSPLLHWTSSSRPALTVSSDTAISSSHLLFVGRSLLLIGHARISRERHHHIEFFLTALPGRLSADSQIRTATIGALDYYPSFIQDTLAKAALCRRIPGRPRYALRTRRSSAAALMGIAYGCSVGLAGDATVVPTEILFPTRRDASGTPQMARTAAMASFYGIIGDGMAGPLHYAI